MLATVSLLLGVLLWQLWQFQELRRDNALIRDLNSNSVQAGTEPKLASSDSALARINERLRRDDLDAAQATISRSGDILTDTAKAHAYYNLANARVRRAFMLVEKGDLDTATAFVNVAKSEYRRALRLAPEFWNAKFNLDVAMRIVRDLPTPEIEQDEAPPDAPKRVWTDLPGVPKGLP